MQADKEELQRRIDRVMRLVENICMSTCDHYHVLMEDCKGCTNYGYIQILKILNGGD